MGNALTQTPRTDKPTRKTGLASHGAIAGVTATAVLLGGFGAFALWQDETGVEVAGTLQTGHLSIGAVSDGGWTFLGDVGEAQDGVLDAGTQIEEISTFRVSPGDVLRWNGTVDVVAEGSDLRAVVDVDKTSVVDDALTGLVAFEVDVDGQGDGSLAVTGDPSGTTQTIDVAVTVSFAREFGAGGTPAGTNGQGLAAAVSLDELTLTLTQATGPAES